MVVKRQEKILITNIFAVWMARYGEAYVFRRSSIGEVREMMEGSEVVFWFSTPGARENVARLLGLENVEAVEKVPGDIDRIVVIGGRGKVTVVERMKRVVPFSFD